MKICNLQLLQMILLSSFFVIYIGFDIFNLPVHHIIMIDILVSNLVIALVRDVNKSKPWKDRVMIPTLRVGSYNGVYYCIDLAGYGLYVTLSDAYYLYQSSLPVFDILKGDLWAKQKKQEWI